MSGKQSKKVRKEKKLSKKVVAGAAAAIIGTAPVVAEGGEFLISIFPDFSFPVVKFIDSLSTGFGGGLQLTYRPNQYFNIFVQGDYKQYSFDTKDSIGNLNLFGGTVGGGYHLPVTDRLGIDFNAGIGYYVSNYKRGSDSSKSFQGLSVSGGIYVSYKINPTISVFAGGGANHYAYKNSKFITSADVAPGVTFNITKAFSNKTNISVNQDELKPVFPVFYSWYNDNPFGCVEVTNNEDVTITDVNVYFFQPQYMSQQKECGKMAKLKQGESFSVDLRAFFNEQMLELNEKNDTMSTITVEYKYLGKKQTATFPMVVPVYGRNNMSWEDDRCASAFVSSKDPAAMWFAKYVVSTIRENIRSGLTTNIQYAMGIFDALDQFGINYVKDPTSAFEDNVGTASIDFLQFPYQTLMYRGGDCDDLSILVCSLLESVGIRTAFITIPGHIFMAFDSGFTVDEAKEYFLTLDEFIVDGDEVWVPLEITLTDEGFNKAWHKGAWEWNTAARNGAAALYKMEDSWKVYRPVNVPGAVARFTLPEETYVARLFTHSVDEFILGQIMPQIAWYENRIAMNPTAQNYNDFGVLYARYGLFEQAEKQFRLARNLEYLPSILNTANLYYSMKDYNRATNWYKEVLASDENNHLAMIGLARCAYEEGNYKECDYWYGTVFNSDIALAKKYSYLGAFESTAGRSFSLADRLENTIWITSAKEPVVTESKTDVTTQVATQTTDVVVKMPKPEVPAETLEDVVPVVAVVQTNIEEENEPEPEEEKTEGGDGDDNDIAVASADLRVEPEDDTIVADDDILLAETDTVVAEVTTTNEIEVPVVESNVAVVEPVEATEELAIVEPESEIETETEIAPEPEVYVGISHELDLNIISVEDLVALAEDTIKEHGETVDDIALQIDESVDFATFVEEDDIKLAETNTVESDIPVPEVIPDTELAVTEETAVAETDTKVAEVEPTDSIDTAIAATDITDTNVDTSYTSVAESDTTDADNILDATDTAIAQTEAPAVEEKIEPLESKPETSVTSVTTDVPLRAVPRFTVQPSAEWAPESAYTAETIPGMKPFEEEMGNYQNEKAFLYKEEEYSFAVNPGEEIKEEEKQDETNLLAALEVNPFSSFLSEKEAEKVEAITNFKVEETVAEVVKASTSAEEIPLPEVIPQPKLAGSEETAVAVPVVESGKSNTDLRVKPEDDTKSPEDGTKSSEVGTKLSEVDTKSLEVETKLTEADTSSTSKKSHGKFIGIIAGVAAAISAVFIANRRKEK